MAIILPSPQSLFYQHSHSHSCAYSPNLLKSSLKISLFTLRSSLQVPETTAKETSAENGVVPGEPESRIQSTVKLQERGCKTCGRGEIEKGCNGEGRIQGGIATVPGFGWWPIKAFRPCPGFVASGGRYRRRGQSMDEVAFGREENKAALGSTNTGKSSERKQSRRRFRK